MSDSDTQQLVPEAHLIEDDIPGFAGPAKRYRLDTPLDGNDTVLIFTSSLFNTPETVVTSGAAGSSIRRLKGSVSGYTSHDYALFIAGYALGAAELPAPEPDPAEGDPVEDGDAAAADGDAAAGDTTSTETEATA